MGCEHAVSCPLFPLLRDSLRGWRNDYCDTRNNWRECARYQRSLTGQRVPINLLPNGYEPQHLKPEASTGRTGTRTAPPAATPGPPPMPPQRAITPRRAIAPPSRTAGFDAIPALPPPRRHGPPPRPQIHPIPDVRASAPQQPAQPARGWWARLIDWMKNPA